MLGYLENFSTESTNFFTNLLLLLKTLDHKSLSKIQNFEFPSNARCFQSASLKLSEQVNYNVRTRYYVVRMRYCSDEILSCRYNLIILFEQDNKLCKRDLKSFE